MPHRPVAILSFALMKNLTLPVLLLSAAFATDQMSHTCRFRRGPLQGQTTRFRILAPRRWARPVLTALPAAVSLFPTQTLLRLRSP